MKIIKHSYWLFLAAFLSLISAEDCAEKNCIAEHAGCTQDPDGCCDGLFCSGYNFFKRCRSPLACLAEWYDCSNGIPCCDDLVCALTENGQSECQVRTIETKLVEDIVVSTPAPTAAPLALDGPNLKTTHIPGTPVKTKTACAVGDPHIYTFDGLAFDCQAEGEFTLMKSKITQREVQGRFAFFTDIFSPGW